MNLVCILHERARKHPEAVAIRDVVDGMDREITFGELSQRIAAGAAFLQSRGLERGDTILLLHPIRIELYEILLAIFHAGMTAMLVDPSAGRTFSDACCRRRRPDGFFGSRKAHLLRLTVPALRRVPHNFHPDGWLPFSRVWAPDGEQVEAVPCDDDTPALITFTSGSTGAPKAAVRTHGFLHAQYTSLAKSLHLADGEEDLITLPVFVLANLAAGVTSNIADTDLRAPGKADAEQIRNQCERFTITRCTASPAFFERLLDHPEGPPALSALYTGGAPVFLDLLDRLRMALPDAKLYAVYGSTEAEPIAEFESGELTDQHRERSRTGGGLPAGHPVEDIEILVIRDQFGDPLGPCSEEELRALVLPPGEAGEIIVTGDHVLAGYLDGIGDEETKIVVGNHTWHRTGDAGSLDRDGHLWLHGRCSARLPGGVYPLALEAALRDLPNCPRTAAIAHRGATLVVEGEERPALTAEIEARIDPSIDRVVYLPAIPLDRRHNAKVDYPALRRALEDR